ncbi:MAG: hypothetical protein ACKPGW_24510, partial [Microcystis panniformis]
NRVNLLRQVRKILRERSRNSNREVWESPSVYGGEDVNYSLALVTIWELFYGVEAKGRINPDGSSEYQINDCR